MDKYLEKLIAELGVAINEAINNSEEVNEVMERIRATGNEVLLAVDATIPLPKPASENAAPYLSIEDRLREISQEDRQFLRSLKIKFDTDD